jgi:hypothetical protein
MIEMTHTCPSMMDPDLRRRVCEGSYVVDPDRVAEAMLQRALVFQPSAPAAQTGSGVLVPPQLDGSRGTVEHDACARLDTA